MSQLPFDNHAKDHHSAAEKKGNLSRTGLLTREPIAIRRRNFGFLDKAKIIKTKVVNSVSFRPEWLKQFIPIQKKNKTKQNNFYLILNLGPF
jgi:hypothetical protein